MFSGARSVMLTLSVCVLLLLLPCAQIRGVFNGAALVFFSFIGFDAVACSAEEVSRRHILAHT
jgi:amino acid transporter